MSSSRAIKSGVALSYFVIIFNIVAGLIYTPWMIRHIGRADYGLYVLVTSFLAYFTVDYGLWQAVNKLVVEYHSNGDFKREHHVVNVASSIYLIIDVCVAAVLLVMFFYIDDVYSNLSSDESSLFKKLFIIASGFALASFPFIFLKGVFMGREFFVQTKYFDIAKRLGVIAITVILLLCDFGVVSLVIAFGIVPLMVCIAEYVFLWKKGFRIRPVRIDKDSARAILGLSLWLFLVVVGEMFIINIAPSVLARYANTTQIAIFAIGLTLYNYVYSFAGAINGFFLPRVYKLKKEKDKEGVLRISSIASGFQMFVVGFFIMGIVCIGEEFINLWVGPDFNSSYTVAWILLIPAIITVCQPIESTELFATNKLKYKALLTVATAVTTVICGVFLAPKYGAIGASFAIGASNLLILGIGLNIVYKKVLHRPRKPFCILVLKYLLAFCLTYIIFGLLNLWIGGANTWIKLFLLCLGYSVIYIYLSYCLALPAGIKKSIIHPLFLKIAGGHKL